MANILSNFEGYRSAYKKKKCIVRSCNHYALVFIAQNYFCVFSPFALQIQHAYIYIYIYIELILHTNHYAHIFSVMVEHTVQK